QPEFLGKHAISPGSRRLPNQVLCSFATPRFLTPWCISAKAWVLPAGCVIVGMRDKLPRRIGNPEPPYVSKTARGRAAPDAIHRSNAPLLCTPSTARGTGSTNHQPKSLVAQLRFARIRKHPGYFGWGTMRR